MNTSKALLKASVFLVWSLILVPFQCVVLIAFPLKYTYILPCLWHKGICYLFGIKVLIEGTPTKNEKVIFVSNHLSYLDIPVIGSLLRASFVAKKEVANWPVFGFLSRLQQTAFIDRNPKTAATGTRAVASMLEQGKKVILFPEGTSSDGRQVCPFKSSIFSIALSGDAEKNEVLIQPFTVRQENVQNQQERDNYAWYGDMDMPPHLWNFAKSTGATIRLIFHEPFYPGQFSNRKTLCTACYNAVEYGLETGKIYKPALDSEASRVTLAS